MVKGYSEYNIASELKVSQSTVSRDIVYLRQKHIQERLPQEYENCMTGINQVLQLTWEIAEKPTDHKTKLKAFAQLNEGYKFKMDLTTNGVVITDAIKYVQGQMDHLNKTEKALPQDIKENKQQEEIEEQKTTNGIF